MGWGVGRGAGGRIRMSLACAGCYWMYRLGALGHMFDATGCRDRVDVDVFHATVISDGAACYLDCVSNCCTKLLTDKII